MPNDSDGTEELLRTHAQYAIHCLSQLDRKSVHVDTIDHLILAILHTDKELKLVHYVSSDFFNRQKQKTHL